MDKLVLPKSVIRAKPTDEEALDWRKLALTFDRILLALAEDQEPLDYDIQEAKRLRAKLEL